MAVAGRTVAAVAVVAVIFSSFVCVVQGATFAEIRGSNPLTSYTGYYEGPFYTKQPEGGVSAGCVGINAIGPYYYYSVTNTACPILPTQLVYPSNFSMPGVANPNINLANVTADTVFKCLNATSGYYLDYPDNFGHAYCNRFETSNDGMQIDVTETRVQGPSVGQCPTENVRSAAELQSSGYYGYYRVTAAPGAVPFRCQ